MRLLLDTHVAIWAVVDPKKVPMKTRRLVETSKIYVSVVSLWEIAIKGRGQPSKHMPMTPEQAFEEFEAAAFQLLDVSAQHALRVADIAFAHRDPFDRLILAQAMAEQMHFVTHDQNLARYSDTVITW